MPVHSQRERIATRHLRDLLENKIPVAKQFAGGVLLPDLCNQTSAMGGHRK
jgi:hypothetical protein